MPIEKRQRSPSVPFISLRWALVHAHQLYERVGRAPLLPSEAAKIWGLGAKTGSAFRRVAALRGYRLIERADDPDRIRISHLTAILFETQEPDARQRAFAAAALGPEIIADYAGRWSAGRPSDPVCIADLQMRHRFTERAAKSFLPVFDEAMWFVGGGVTGVVTAVPQAPSPSPSVSIGDLCACPPIQAISARMGAGSCGLPMADAMSMSRKTWPDTPSRRSPGSSRPPAPILPPGLTDRKR